MARVKRSSDRRRHCFGAHLSVAGGLHLAIVRAREIGFDTVQVFVKNQRQWQAPPLDPDEQARWLDALAAGDFGPPIAHASYLVNLASPNRTLLARSRAAFADELQRCDALRIPWLVVHPGSATGSSPTAALARVARTLNRIFDRLPGLHTGVLLETTAGQGTSLGRSFAELGEILAHVEQPDRVGVCLDTCHLFAAGYDLREPSAYSAMVAEADREVGLGRVRCWHLNDCKGACGSHLDRHDHIGRGQIGNRGFTNLLTDPRFAGVPMILETPKGETPAGRDFDALNLSRLRRLAKQAR
ncbi:MAG: deoxyribonuclease IV [Phycisphaerae bacterium]|jgi:deoxyribonuclease-4